jgi:hypothetical protein
MYKHLDLAPDINIFRIFLSHIELFLFLFGFIWVFWDAFHALFMTRSLLQNGITPPLPYSFFFSEPISSSAFMVNKPLSSQTGGFDLDSLAPDIQVPVLSYKKTFQPFVAPIAEKVAEFIKDPQVPSISNITNTLKSVVAPTPAPVVQQTGGGVGANAFGAQSGPGPAIAGVLAAVVLAGGLKGMYDFLKNRV